jgi:hypothetical protein
MKPEEWLIGVLERVAANRPPRFAGLGLVLYAPPLDLPVAPLAPSSQMPKLSGADIRHTAELLCRLSDSTSTLHDGFHLVDSSTLVITAFCHFFAPPIPVRIPTPIPDHPVGARFMAALLGSLLPSVVMTAVLSETEGAIVFERGVTRRLTMTSD